MNSTETTPAPAVGGRQIGQVLAGRYRLGLFKGGDDLADVWHALDDSTEMVVTLEILRDRDNEPARQRFLAEARRMAAIERPSVMRVAAIHDDATDTFIVFEHLIPLPVVLTGLTGVARDVKPATKAAEDTAALLAAASPPQTPTVAPEAAPSQRPIVAPAAALPETPTVVPSTLSAIAGPTRSATAQEAVWNVASAPTIVGLDAPNPPAPQLVAPTARVPETLQAVTRSLISARPHVSGAVAWATRFAADARLLVGDIRPNTLVVAARGLVAERVDTSRLTTLLARVTTSIARGMALVGRATTLLARVTTLVTNVTTRMRQFPGVVSQARVSSPRAAEPAKSDEARVRLALPRIASLGTPFAAAGSAIARVLRSRVVLGGAALMLLAVVVIASPLDETIVDAIRSAIAPSPTAAPPTALKPAPFDLPPLSAYGAAFESQGAYPTTTPDGTVEWVVALRNTGSAGWYRGFEGAQAALALPDGAGVAVQSTDYVAPGQVGWFVVHFRARAELGTYTVQLLPRIDGRGPLQDLGIFTVVTVSKNP